MNILERNQSEHTKKSPEMLVTENNREGDKKAHTQAKQVGNQATHLFKVLQHPHLWI